MLCSVSLPGSAAFASRGGGSNPAPVMASADLLEELTCAVCLNIYSDPVTLTCGHSFCRTCIGNLPDRKEEHAPTCPECRAPITSRPELKRNHRLCNIAKQFSSPQPRMKKAGIECTYCDDSPAAKTCLHCEASLCKTHLRVHSKSKEHVLVEPTTSLQNRRCAIHKEVLKYFCCEDAVCICASCGLVGAHAGHTVETLNVAAEKRKEDLKHLLANLTSERDDVWDEINNVEDLKVDLVDHVAIVMKRVAALINGVQDQLEALRKQMDFEIFRQKKETMLRASGLTRQLEAKKEELLAKMCRVRNLCKVTDPLTLLQGPESESHNHREMDGLEDFDRCDEDAHHVVKLDVDLILENLRIGLSHIVHEAKRQCHVPEASGWLPDADVTLEALPDVDSSPGTAPAVEIDTDTEPDEDAASESLSDSASDILPDADVESEVSLDVNTASNYLDISADLKSVSWAGVRASRPNGPERFYYPQVLSSQSFSSGRHDWEVEGADSGGWLVGMAYHSIDRKDKSAIGDNKKSWGLERVNARQYSVRYNGKAFYLPNRPSCSTIKVHLDYKAGELSFYELGDPVRHLHTFVATFTEPLHLAFWVFVYDSRGEQRDSWARIL